MARQRLRASRKIVGVLLAAALTMGVAGVADAFTITQIGTSNGNPGGLPVFQVSGLVEGDSFPILWSAVNGDLSATATITVFDLTSTQLLLDVVLTNTSPEISNGDPRITSFGLGINPNISGGSVSDIGGGTDVDALTGFSMSNFPGFQGVELCAVSGNNCAGGASGGLESGNPDLTDAFRFTLNFTNPNLSNELTLSQFALKYQGGPPGPGGDSFQIPGTPGNGEPPIPPTQVPGPGTLMLVGAGLMGMAAAAGRTLVRRR
jgi:hypothetical protein